MSRTASPCWKSGSETNSPRTTRTARLANVSRPRARRWGATASALPQKTAAPSSPERRRASRTPFSPSTAKAREMASNPARSTATQKRPGATRGRRPRSGSRAKANRSSTIPAKGSTWLRATRERASIRRSLPATSSAWRTRPGVRGAFPEDVMEVSSRALQRQDELGQVLELVLGEPEVEPDRVVEGQDVVEQRPPGGGRAACSDVSIRGPRADPTAQEVAG